MKLPPAPGTTECMCAGREATLACCFLDADRALCLRFGALWDHVSSAGVSGQQPLRHIVQRHHGGVMVPARAVFTCPALVRAYTVPWPAVGNNATHSSSSRLDDPTGRAEVTLVADCPHAGDVNSQPS